MGLSHATTLIDCWFGLGIIEIVLHNRNTDQSITTSEHPRRTPPSIHGRQPADLAPRHGSSFCHSCLVSCAPPRRRGRPPPNRDVPILEQPNLGFPCYFDTRRTTFRSLHTLFNVYETAVSILTLPPLDQDTTPIRTEAGRQMRTQEPRSRLNSLRRSRLLDPLRSSRVEHGRGWSRRDTFLRRFRGASVFGSGVQWRIVCKGFPTGNGAPERRLFSCSDHQRKFKRKKLLFDGDDMKPGHGINDIAIFGTLY